MAVPKRKTSKSKNRMRQAGKGLVRKTNLKLDDKGNVTMSHVLVLKREKKEKKEGE
jgi:ribosomal protein L32